jgi:CxxC-x17-CxxC domain-containing protein
VIEAERSGAVLQFHEGMEIICASLRAEPVFSAPNAARKWQTRETFSMEFQDKRLVCVNCGREFIFTAGEQQFFREKELFNEPKRCRPCKLEQTVQTGPQPGAATKRVETTVTCTRCGKETTVPFVPTQGRPVLCRECFHPRRSSAGARQRPGSRNDRDAMA